MGKEDEDELVAIYAAPDDTVEVDHNADENLRLVLILPKAEMMASNGRSELSIIQFLKQHGIEDGIAVTTARDLCLKHERKLAKLHLPIKIFGWLLVVLGVCEMFIGFTPYRFLNMFAPVVMLFGFYIVFGVCTKRGVEL